jgi:hypothetical protein
VVSNPLYTGGDQMSDDLFVIQNVYLEGKQIHKFLRAVTGIIVKADLPRPVINAVATKTEVKAKSQATGVKARFTELVRQFNKGTDLPTSQLRTLLKEAGAAEGGSGYYTQALKEDKVLKMKSRGLWTVI